MEMQYKNALFTKGLKEADLPKKLQLKIKKLDEYITKYNEACQVYESKQEEDPELAADLEKAENYIEETDKQLADEIAAFQTEAPEKKSSGGGSGALLVIGGIIITAITLGAVNGFKNK